jgi:hypothetical protein
MLCHVRIQLRFNRMVLRIVNLLKQSGEEWSRYDDFI